MTVVTHVLFDMDGLLLNTEQIYSEVSQEIAERYGKTYDWSVKSQVMGLKEQAAAELVVKLLELPMTPEEYLRERKIGHTAKFPLCKPLPGVMKLVLHLKKHGIPICVATSSHRDSFEMKSRNNQELFALFDGHIVTGDDQRIRNGKPAPDIFEVAAREIGNDLFDRSTCLVFEDSLMGVQAGLNARMRVVWIPDPNLHMDDALVGQCDVLQSMQQFDPSQYGLPSFSE